MLTYAIHADAVPFIRPNAGHVHCMLAWSNESLQNWQWVDPAGLDALKEFIPAGKLGSFESHVCFAGKAHYPTGIYLTMASGTLTPSVSFRIR